MSPHRVPTGVPTGRRPRARFEMPEECAREARGKIMEICNAVEANPVQGREGEIRTGAARTALAFLDASVQSYADGRPGRFNLLDDVEDVLELAKMAITSTTQAELDDTRCCASVLHYVDARYRLYHIKVAAGTMRNYGWVVAGGALNFEHVVAVKKLNDYSREHHLDKELHTILESLLVDVPRAVDDTLVLLEAGKITDAGAANAYAGSLNVGKYSSMPHRDSVDIVSRRPRLK